MSKLWHKLLSVDDGTVKIVFFYEGNKVARTALATERITVIRKGMSNFYLYLKYITLDSDIICFIKHPMYTGVPNILFNETCTYVECTEKEAVLGYVHRKKITRGNSIVGRIKIGI